MPGRGRARSLRCASESATAARVTPARRGSYSSPSWMTEREWVIPQSDRWLLRVCAEHASIDARLVCFPFAGGSASFYRPWRALLSPRVELCAVQLPGRESRFGEPLIRDREVLIAHLMGVIAPLLDKPCIFFGHSMGAMLAQRVARGLVDSRGRGPAALFVSAHPAPQLPVDSTLSELPDEQFIAKLRQYGGTPKAVLENMELMRLMLPVLRNDVQIAARPALPNAVRMSIPIAALGGETDRSVTREELAAWGEVTDGEFSLRMLPGDHFFLSRRASEVLAQVGRAFRGEGVGG